MKTYSDYFEIDSGYYPEINPSSIKDPNTRWDKTYPHPTFVNLLEDTQRMLAREDNTRKKGIWIEGAYGTGKSRVAWTLRSLLDCSEDEFNDYFDAYDALENKHDLRAKLLASKRGRIVTAYRYGSGLSSIQDFIVAVFDSVTEALENARLDARGNETIRGRIVAWLSDDTNRQVFELYLDKPENRGRGCLAGKSVDDIIAQLKNNDQDASGLIGDILALAQASGIQAFRLSMEDLTSWISEVIDANKITSLVFVWDEFSSFFKNNRTSLDEFQKLAELSSEKPFYLVIVTHMAGLLSSEGDQAFKIVRDRFVHCNIELPDSVAFDLIGNALEVNEAGQDEWEAFADDLNDRMLDSRKAVREAVGGATDGTLKRLLPLHPMAALLLKHISTTFASNQRSMFNFINSDNADDLQAFQWFIKTHGPEDEIPILTIDFLWNFFYEKGTDEYTSQAGRSNLDFIVAATLDTYPSHEQELNSEERRVLKTILMMQAISQKLNNSVAILRPTERNIDLAFQGDGALDGGRAVSIANNMLVGQRKILYINPTENGNEFAASAVSGDQVQIDAYKQQKLRETSTKRLVEDAKFQDAVEGALPVALRTRFKMSVAYADNLKRIANSVADAEPDFHLQAILCFARNEEEQVQLRKFIRTEAVKEQYRDVVFIDTSDNMLGVDRFNEWATFAANEQYWRNKDSNQADNQKRNADQILNAWKSAVAQGPFEVTRGGEGQRCSNIEALKRALADAVSVRFPLAFDHARVTESLFSQNGLKKGAQLGIDGECGGIYQASSIASLLGEALRTEGYWQVAPWRTQPIGKLKQELDDFIREQLDRDGRVSLLAVHDFLADRGFMPCNLYAYLMGFLLREYTDGSYRYGVGETGEDGGVMSSQKLAEFIEECIKHRGVRAVSHYREKYLEIMTAGQKRFVDFAHRAFDVPEGLSVEQAASRVRAFLANFGCPVWCLKNLREASGLDALIDALTFIVNPRAGENVLSLTEKFGQLLGTAAPGDQERLSALMNRESGLDALRRYLDIFEGGELSRTASAIGVADVVGDVRAQIGSGEKAWLWDRSVAEEELRRLLVDYRIVERTNAIAGMNESHTFRACMDAWKTFARFTHIPSQSLRAQMPELAEIVRCVEIIVRDGSLPHERRAGFLDELERHGDEFADFLARRSGIFAELFASFVEGLSQSEIDDLYSRLPASSFTDDLSTFAQAVNGRAESLRANQRRYQLRELWERVSHARDGHEWSRNHKTPILALVPDGEQEAARRLFEALRAVNPSEADVDASIEYLQGGPRFLESLESQEDIDAAFVRTILGRYGVVLTDLDEVRNDLSGSVTPEAYGWYGSPRVLSRVKEMANRVYLLGASAKVASFIDDMTEASAKEFLKRLASDDLEVGISVMGEGRGRLSCR